MTRWRLLAFVGLPPLRFAAFFLLAAAIVIRPALFVRAAFLVGFAIGFRLAFRLRFPLGLRLPLRFRAFLRLGARPFVPRPRFRLAPMPFALVPLARLTCISLRTFAGLAISRLCFTSVALTRRRFFRLARAPVACRCFLGFTGASFACRRFVGVARRALACFTLLALAIRTGPVGGFPSVTLPSLARLALARFRFACRDFPAMTLAGFTFFPRLTFTRRSLFRLPRPTRTRLAVLRLPCRLCISQRLGILCGLRVSGGLRLPGGLGFSRTGGFRFGRRQRSMTRDGHTSRRRRL